MVIYSHSRLSDYESCPLMFKFRNIDKIKEDGENIEAFLGNQVHEALHFIYNKAKTGKIPQLKEILEFYRSLWKRNFNKNIKIVKKGFSAESYFKQGEEMIKKYYEKNKPFDENIIGMEQKIMIDLMGDGKYVLRGFIDKLIHNKNKGIYEIHDYKTSSWLPEQEELDEDRQLGLYALAIKETYPDCKSIILRWHFLKQGVEFTSSRKDSDFKKLKKRVIELINKIENEKKWPARKSGLCAWCRFNEICPEYKKLL